VGNYRRAETTGIDVTPRRHRSASLEVSFNPSAYISQVASLVVRSGQASNARRNAMRTVLLETADAFWAESFVTFQVTS
jgi:hypothetical protein